MSAVRPVPAVGDGIAGLATARTLRLHGIECDVIERAPG
jgi:predicted NAD/FAD-dependent oxidoreductase